MPTADDTPSSVHTFRPLKALATKPGWAVALLLLAAAAGYVGFRLTAYTRFRLSQAEAPAPLTPQWLAVSEESLDFSEVWLQEGFALTLPIRNTASHPVEIVQLSSSCGCAVVAPTAVTIPPGECRDVTVTLDLGFSRSATPDADTYPFTAAVFAEARCGQTGTAAVFSWDIHGYVRRAFQLSQRSVDFGDAVTLGQTPTGASVGVRPLVPLRRLSAECDPAQASVTIEKDTTESAKQSERVLITPSPTLPRGSFAFAVKIRGETMEGELLPAQAIAVKGEVMPNVRVSPRTIDFGLLSVGQKREMELYLYSHNGEDFSLCGVEGPPSVTVSPPALPPGSPHIVTAVIQTNDVGKISGEHLR